MMQEEKKPAQNQAKQHGGKKRGRFNTISHKLMAFMILLSAVLLILVWLLSVKMLEPMYNYRVREELSHAADVYAEILQRNEALVGYDSMGRKAINSSLMDELRENSELLAGKCFEIADENLRCLIGSHQIQSGRCLLHPDPLSLFSDHSTPQWDSTEAVDLRAAVFEQGDMDFILPNAERFPDIDPQADTRQMVVCRNVDNRYTVIVSTDLERVDQAAGVIRAQMPLIAAGLLIISIAGAYVFAKWFTKPIRALSGAAREVARGNYKVQVEAETDDELGMLAEDFNTMAREVGRTSELQRDLIANVSHDLRTPLTLIKGYAETVRDLTGDDKEKRDAQLNVIADETDRLSALVNSVMELSRYSSGSQKPQRVHFDLAQLCEEVAYRYENICEKNGYTLITQTDVPCEVDADPDMMSRVVHNLLGNAVHHVGDDGKIILRVMPQPDGKVRVEIEDHGAGISKEDLPYIFDKYYRSRSDAGKVGTGLGLSITKAILISHGYAFGVDSTLGEGSVFWFTAQ